MGAWGEDIFENDGALDCLGDVIDSFVESIDEWFERGLKESGDYDNIYEENIGPLVFMLEKLCKYCPAYPPVPSKVNEWRSIFFSVYDKHATEGWGEESAEHRKKLFDKEFTNLLEVSIKYHGDLPTQPICTEGTCLALKLYIGGYGAAIVLHNEFKGDQIYSLIGGLKGVYKDIPTKEVFEKREWLYLTHHNFKNDLNLIWTAQKDLMENKDQIVVIGQTNILDTDPSSDIDEMGVGFGGIGVIENQIWKQYEWDNKKA